MAQVNKTKTAYNFPVNDYSGVTNLKINSCFDITYKETKDSPIDAFFKNAKELSMLLTTVTFTERFANLILLGYLSAVESYLRQITRKIILIDKDAFKACESIEVKFGSAYGHNGNNLIPEILLEKVSFADRDNILNAFNKYLNLNKQNFPPDVQEILLEFSIVCELRHCIVHRSGKLGAKNALILGLNDHIGNIEKPIKLEIASLNQIITVCHNTVKVINNYLFKEIMMRLISDCHKDENYKAKINTRWTWIYKKDRKEFKKYFDIFISKISPPPNPKLKDAFIEYHKVYSSLPR